MSYELDQSRFKKELQVINLRISELDRLFENSPEMRFHYNVRGNDLDAKRDYYSMILSKNYGDFNTFFDSVFMLEYKLCQHKKKNIELKLKQSRQSYNVSKTLDYVDGITPRHVSGRIYEIKDGDGCGTFLFWFFIVVFVIIFIMYCLD